MLRTMMGRDGLLLAGVKSQGCEVALTLNDTCTPYPGSR